MAPVKLQIPEQYAGALAEFLKLPAHTLASLLKLLREEQPTLEINDLIATVADSLSLEHRQVREIFQVLSSLYAARENLGAEVPEFVSELRAAAERSGKEDLNPSDWTAFENALTEALSTDTALAISAKAIGVLTDHPHTYWYARVLTDLRPIFRTDLGSQVPAMVVVHHLKLAYREAGEQREFFVALDSLDVVDLIALLQRAQEKEEALRALAEQKGLNLLEVKS